MDLGSGRIVQPVEAPQGRDFDGFAGRGAAGLNGDAEGQVAGRAMLTKVQSKIVA